MNDLKIFWENKVPKGHKHFMNDMSNDKINNLKKRVKENFLDNINFTNINTVYDWGCGGGIHTKTLSELSKVTPLDISEESLKECYKNTGIEGILLTDKIKLPKVDMIFCADVVHHFPSLSYLNNILDKWLEINPIYICVQFKISKENIESNDYFNKNNYINGIHLKENYIYDFLKKEYEKINFTTQKSKNGDMTHGFLILKNKMKLNV